MIKIRCMICIFYQRGSLTPLPPIIPS